MKARVFYGNQVDEGEDHAWGYDDWMHQLRQMNMIVTPMIWRQGACVTCKLADGTQALGCIVRLS